MTYGCARQEFPHFGDDCNDWLKCIKTPAHLNIDMVEILTSALFSGPVKLIEQLSYKSLCIFSLGLISIGVFDRIRNKN